MSTALQLCQKIHLILRIGEEAPGTQPASIAGQTGVSAEIVRWASESQADIARLHDNWLFLQLGGSISLPITTTTIALAAIVTAIPTIDRVVPFVDDDGAFVLVRATTPANAAETQCRYISFQDWYGYRDVAPLPNGMPSAFTIAPNGSLIFDTISDKAYTVRFLYRPKVVPFAADGDVPVLPTNAHDVIVWWAIVHYYCTSRDGSNETRTKAQVELNRELTAMRNRWLPALLLG